MITYGSPHDVNKNELRNAVAHNSAGTPSSPATGQYWVDTSDANKLKWWDGSSVQTAGGGSVADATTGSKGIVQLAGDLAGTAASPQIAAGAIVDADVNASAAIALSKLATNPLARANHTGTQTASTISDFDTQVRTSRLDQMAAPTADVALNSRKITGLANGTSAADAAAWGQVQALVQGVRWLGARAASLANLGLSGTGTVDSVSISAGDYILAKNQTATAENGLYVAAAGAWSRAPEMDTAAELDGKVVVIEDGSQAGTLWVTTSDVTTLGTDPVSFTQFNSVADIVAGAALTKTGTTLDVAVDNASVEVNADALRVKAAGVTNAMLAGSIDLTSKVTGALPVANGGTGQTAAKAARETGLVAAGYYNTETHGAGTTISITQATHGLRASKGLNVQTYDIATGDRRIDDINVAASGNVTITFAVSQSANTVGVVITG